MISALLKDVFIPEKSGNYYLLSQRVLGFVITKSTVHATQLLRHGYNVTIERFFTEALPTDPAIAFTDRVAVAIKNIVAQADRYDAIRTSLQSSTAIFKNLTLPFLDHEKISMVLTYEIEPYLPFPTTEAVIDFIITKSNKEQKSSEVLVCAVQKSHLVEHLNYFQSAGITPDVVTIDLFDVYGLYCILPKYKTLKGAVALVDSSFSFTSIAYLIDGQLTLLRTLPKGITFWAKTIAQSLSLTPQDALEKIIRFGLDKTSEESYGKAITDAVGASLNDIKFTLDSFRAQTAQHKELHKILLLGDGAELPHITTFFTEHLGTECEEFDTNSLLKEPRYTLKKGKKIPQAETVSLSTALATPVMDHFNLLKHEFAPTTHPLFTKQIITTLVLVASILVSLIGVSIIRINTLKKEVASSEQEVLSVLKKLGLANAKSLSVALREAEEKVAEEEAIWFAFSQQTRVSFLKYLERLSVAIDRKALGLKITKFVITHQDPSSLTLEGEVKDFEALKVLERELKNTNLFLTIPSLQTTKFTLQMPLKKNGVTS